MKRASVCALAIVVAMSFVLAAYADTSREEAKSLVEKAVKFAEKNGKEKAVAEFNKQKGQFDKGELYVFAYDMDITMIAHPKNPGLVGKNLRNAPDYQGKLFRKEIPDVMKAKGEGWFNYHYMNPETHKVEAKTTYCKKQGQIIVCCGAYQ